jgi:hypothetical protein
MALPHAAEDEFVLSKQHLAQALSRDAMPVPVGSNAHDHDLYALLADTAAQQRDAESLRQFAPLAEELARRDEHLLYQAVADRAWGVAHRLAGQLADSEARLLHALEVFRRLGTRWQLGRTLYELGELALVTRDWPAARARLGSALAEFEAMRAVRDAARVRAALASLG